MKSWELRELQQISMYVANEISDKETKQMFINASFVFGRLASAKRKKELDENIIVDVIEDLLRGEDGKDG